MLLRRRFRAITSIETLTVAQLEEMRGSAAGMMTGTLPQVVGIVGAGLWPTPVIAPLSRIACAGYRSSANEDFNLSIPGMGLLPFNRVALPISSDEAARFAELWIRDSSGKVELELSGASIDFLPIIDHESSEGGADNSLGSSDFREEESILPLETPLYVVGEAVEDNGRLVVRKPTVGDAPLFVSLTSPEAKLSYARNRVRQAWGVGIAFAGIGAGLMVLG